MSHYLVFSSHWNRDNGLDWGRLSLNCLDKGNLAIWTATSSAGDRQNYEGQFQKNGCIPSNYYHPQSQQVYSKIETEQLSSSDKEKLIFFPSIHEFKVYRVLLSLTDKFLLEVHPSIEIIPPKVLETYPLGKRWTADFLLRDKANKSAVAIIEAKGAITREFPYILALLELHNKELFEKTWLIFPLKIPTHNQVIKRLMEKRFHRVETLTSFTKRIAPLTNTTLS